MAQTFLSAESQLPYVACDGAPLNLADTAIPDRPDATCQWVNGAWTASTAAHAALVAQAKALLADRTTLDRIQEAIILGKTTAAAADVVAWMTWRGKLRAIVNGSDTTSTALPSQPAFPAGT